MFKLDIVCSKWYICGYSQIPKTMIGVILVDKWGRRPLLLVSTFFLLCFSYMIIYHKKIKAGGMIFWLLFGHIDISIWDEHDLRASWGRLHITGYFKYFTVNYSVLNLIYFHLFNIICCIYRLSRNCNFFRNLLQYSRLYALW